MSQQTGRGTPYVEPTDALTEYPTTSRELAEQIDKLAPRIAVALGTVKIASGQSAGTVDVPFRVTFPAAPSVLACVNGPTAAWAVAVSGITTTKCTVSARHIDANTGGNDVVVRVLAIAPGA